MPRRPHQNSITIWSGLGIGLRLGSGLGAWFLQGLVRLMLEDVDPELLNLGGDPLSTRFYHALRKRSYTRTSTVRPP